MLPDGSTTVKVIPVIRGEEPKDVYARPVINGKATWGPYYFGFSPVTIEGVILVSSNGSKHPRPAELLVLPADGTLEITVTK